MEAALQLVETNEVETRALSVVDQAKSVKVIDAESYVTAGQMYTSIVAMMKEVDDAFDKNIKRWHEGHKGAIADKAKYWNPLDAAKRAVKKALGDYDAEQERIRRAEEARLQEIARKEEEERKLAEAIAAEQSGDKQEAEAIMEEPVYVAPVVVKKEVPKVEGVVFRTVWKFRIIDEKKIPREYLTPDSVKIGGVVRSMKKATNIPGIQVYEERV
jgi:hypothetical protein